MIIYFFKTVGTKCTTIGWGANKVQPLPGGEYAYRYPRYLQVLRLKVIDKTYCNVTDFPGQIQNHEFCAGTNVLNKATCEVNICFEFEMQKFGFNKLIYNELWL